MEQDTVRRVMAGDRDAFRELYDLYFDYAMRTAWLVTKNGEWAKDAVQETFVRVYRNLGQYDGEKPFKPWLYRILLRECYRVMEREKKIVPIGEQMDRLESLPHEAAPRQLKSDLYEALQSIADLYRIPLILKYLHDYSEKEIADMLELNVNTLKSRLLKGREKLRNILGGEPYGTEG